MLFFDMIGCLQINLRTDRDQTMSTSTIQIFVKTMSGETISLDVEPSLKIEDFREKIKEKDDSLIVSRLWFVNKWVDDNHTLADYNITNGSTVHILYNKVRCPVE